MNARTPSDPELWVLAVCAMQDQGIREQTARGFLSLCLKAWEERYVREAVIAALGKADFKAYCKAVLSRKPPRRPPPSVQACLLAEQAAPADPETARAKIAQARQVLKR